MDQYENMKRNQEIHRQYKKKLIDELLKKEQKYFRVKRARDHASQQHMHPI